MLAMRLPLVLMLLASLVAGWSGHEAEMDMSGSSDNDGETKAGHYGDYSDWISRYHIGKHHAYHASKAKARPIQRYEPQTVAAAPHRPAVAPSNQKLVESVAPSRSSHPATPTKQAAPHPNQKVARTNHAAKQHEHKVEANQEHHPKQAAQPTPARTHDPAAALDDELRKLEQHAGIASASHPKDAKGKKAATPHAGDTADGSTKPGMLMEASSEGEAELSAADGLEDQLQQLEKQSTFGAVSNSNPKRSDHSNSGGNPSLEDLEASLHNLEANPDVLLQFAPAEKGVSSTSETDTMGAAYTHTQQEMHLSNFPRLSTHAGAAARTHPNPSAAKVVPAPKVKSAALVSLAGFDASVDRLDARKSKLSKMLDHEVAKALQARDEREAEQSSASFDAQLDELSAAAASDADAVMGTSNEVVLLQEGSGAESKASAKATTQAKISAASTSKSRAKSEAAAPDMMAMLAQKFKRQSAAVQKKRVAKMDSDEDVQSQQEAKMAAAFQAKFTASLNKKLDAKLGEGETVTLQQAMATHDDTSPEESPTEATSLLTHKSKETQEAKEMQKDAELAKKMTADFLKYHATHDSTRKQEVQTPTKGDLKSLFGRRSHTRSSDRAQLFRNQHDQDMADEDADRDELALEEKGSSLDQAKVSQGQERAIKMAKMAVRATEARHKAADKVSSSGSKEALQSLFGVSRPEKKENQKVNDQLLNDDDRRALRLQQEMTQQMQERSSKSADEKSETQEGDISSLFRSKQAQHPAPQVGLSKQTRSEFDRARRFQEGMLKRSQQHRHPNEGTSGDKVYSRDQAESLFGHESTKSKQKQNLGEPVGLAEKRAQEQMLQASERRTSEDSGADDNSQVVSRSAAEHLFDGRSKPAHNSRALPFLKGNARKKVMQEFTESAEHQIRLLHMMQQSQDSELAERASSAVQLSTKMHAADSKWDELAYQNKLRALFGAPLKKAPKPQPRTHKKAVSQFLDTVRRAEGKQPSEAEGEQKEDQRDQTRQKFQSLIQEETAEFNKVMETKKRSLGAAPESARLLSQLRQKFDEFKNQVSDVEGPPQEQSMVQIDAGSGDKAAPEPRNDPAQTTGAAVQVVGTPSSGEVRSSMVDRISKLFQDA